MNSLIKFEGCEGFLSWVDYSIKLPFDLLVSPSGEIKINFGSQPLTSDNIWLEIAHLQKNTFVEVLKLEGTTSDGYSIKSDSLFLTKSDISSDQNGSLITVEATASRIDIESKKKVKTSYEARIDFFIAGLQCFGTIKIDNELGSIIIGGASKIEDYSKICGLVSFKKNITKTENYTEWFESVKVKAEMIQHILSLANGRFLRTNIIKIYKAGNLSDLILYRGFSSTKPYKPPFSYLHLRPIIELGIENYTKELISKTGMDVALEWHLMSHKYNEDRYLGQMTALEHLVHVFREQRPSNCILQKSKFRKILKPALQERLDELIPALCDDPQDRDKFVNIIEEIKGKIGNLNMQTLQSSLQSMLAEYRVPLDGLDEFIPDLIKVRNKIVHRGLHAPKNEQKPLTVYLSAAEELLRRIFLSLLDYEGNYQTYFNTVDFRYFSRLPHKNPE